MAIEYCVYTNSGAGDPINYASPVATVSALTCTLPGLTCPGTWSFGVRAIDTVSGLEEQNLDCAVTVVLDASGNDLTKRPGPPSGLRAFALAGGTIRAEWYYPPSVGSNAPLGFHAYVGTGGSPNYSTPAATVLFATGAANTFVANLASMTNGTTYTIGVRAYNATAEEPNIKTVSVTADSTGPEQVDSLAGFATALA
jgi:hypothetical protein